MSHKQQSSCFHACRDLTMCGMIHGSRGLIQYLRANLLHEMLIIKLFHHFREMIRLPLSYCDLLFFSYIFSIIIPNNFHV